MLATLSVLKAAAGLTLERGTTLAKRAISEVHKDHMGDGMIIMMGKDDKQPAQIQMPGMFWFALVAVFLVFLPILFLVSLAGSLSQKFKGGEELTCLCT